MLRKRLTMVLGLIALVLLLAACGAGSGSNASTKAANGADTAKVHRGGTLVVAMDQNPVGDRFDPMKQGDTYTGFVTSAVTEGLIKYNDKLEPTPWLAESYDVSNDGLTYTFNLRKGVKFHDGTEMDAAAAKFSVDRVRDEKNKQWPRYGDGQFISDTQVTDKYTFKIILKEPASPFPSRLAGGLGAIVSPTAFETMGEDAFSRAPVGTGPFKFKEYKSDSYVRVERFDGYWRNGADGKALPYVGGIEWRIITEPANRLIALQAGDVHVIATLRDQDVKLVKADSNLVLAQTPSLGFTGFQFNLSVPPFDNKALRQAVQFAIDRKEIVDAVYEGNREVGYLPIPIPTQWAIDQDYKPYPYDPAKARQKLAEGGKPNGFEFTASAASGNAITQQLYELMQAQLAKVGIKMNIELADFNGVVVPKWQHNDPDSQVWAISWTAAIDPDLLLTNLFTKGGSSNFAKYDNPKYDELVAAARKSSNRDERAKAYKEALKLVMDDSPYAVLVYGLDRYVGQKKVKGWFVGTKATTSYSEYWLEE